MAAFFGTATTAEIATGTSVKTILQLVAASNHIVRILSWSISFKGVSPTAVPIIVQLARQSTAGTTSANTPKKLNDGQPETLQTTARDTATVEPTTGDILETLFIHPQTGFKTPSGYEMLMGGSDRIGWLTTAAADVGCIVTVHFEE